MSNPTNPQQPPLGPPPQPMQPAPAPVAKPPKPKRFGWLALILVAVAALLVGSALGAIGDNDSGGGEVVARPGSTVTVTEAADPDPGPEPDFTEEPEPTEEPAGYVPKKSDWEVKVKVTDKQCFGSAGCSIDYKITPEYVGSRPLPDEGVIEVTFEITGDEDPIIGTFTVEGDRAEYEKEGSMSTPRSSTKVRSRITDVEYDPEG